MSDREQFISLLPCYPELYPQLRQILAQQAPQTEAQETQDHTA